MKQILKNNVVVEVLESVDLDTIDTKIQTIGREDNEDAFYVGNLGDIVHKYKVFRQELPRVRPFYAVKCNDDSAILSVLAALGTGFDCASKAEIQKVLNLGVQSKNIVYANPCKQASHIRFAAKNDVPLMTFDNETELHKIKSIYPNAKLVIRILPPDDKSAECQFGMKYGVHKKDIRKLLKVAKDLELNIVGVSFHVGSGCYDASAFASAVRAAWETTQLGEELGFDMKLLDIGGGFPGTANARVSFEEITAVLRNSLDQYYPEGCGVSIIAEPGRYFVASAFTLTVNIIAKRAVTDSEDTDSLTTKSFMYYVNDGVYGSFNCIMFDHAKCEPSLLKEPPKDVPLYNSSVWGPTCDGLDCINESCLLPEMKQGDWLLFHNMGAYTMSAASTFNGMPKPCVYYVFPEEQWLSVCDLLPSEEFCKKDEEVKVKEKQQLDLTLTSKLLDSWISSQASYVSDPLMESVTAMVDFCTIPDM